jgi:hypothetical protein
MEIKLKGFLLQNDVLAPLVEKVWGKVDRAADEIVFQRCERVVVTWESRDL